MPGWTPSSRCSQSVVRRQAELAGALDISTSGVRFIPTSPARWPRSPVSRQPSVRQAHSGPLAARFRHRWTQARLPQALSSAQHGRMSPANSGHPRMMQPVLRAHTAPKQNGQHERARARGECSIRASLGRFRRTGTALQGANRRSRATASPLLASLLSSPPRRRLTAEKKPWLRPCCSPWLWRPSTVAQEVHLHTWTAATRDAR